MTKKKKETKKLKQNMKRKFEFQNLKFSENG